MRSLVLMQATKGGEEIDALSEDVYEIYQKQEK